MIETKMAQTFKKKLKDMPVNFHKIESGSTEVGFPDWYLRTEWIDLWIEAKELKRWPTRASTRIIISYRPGQYNWIMQHRKLGGKVLLIVTYKDRWHLFHDIRLDYTIKEFEFLSLIPTDLKMISKYKLINIMNAASQV